MRTVAPLVVATLLLGCTSHIRPRLPVVTYDTPAEARRWVFRYYQSQGKQPSKVMLELAENGRIDVHACTKRKRTAGPEQWEVKWVYDGAVVARRAGDKAEPRPVRMRNSVLRWVWCGSIKAFSPLRAPFTLRVENYVERIRHVYHVARGGKVTHVSSDYE